MTHKFKIERDYYDTGEKIYNKSSVEIKEGLTVLCGCNGCGKTTLLHQIERILRKEKIPVVTFDNLRDGGDRSIESSLDIGGDMDFVFQASHSSEGENIYLNIGKFARKMKVFVKKYKSEKEIFFLMDAIDSGLSIDHVIDFKKFFNVVIEDCRSKGISPYIIVSANEYELARKSPCLDTLNLKYVNFPTYESYRDYIIRTRKAKNKRYKWEEWSEEK